MPSHGQRIAVEDDDAVRTMLCEAIEFAGHEVRSVRGCAEATAALAGASYALVVTDARLPDGSGRDLAKAAVQRGARAIISGHPDELESSAACGVRSLRKPFRDALHALAR